MRAGFMLCLLWGTFACGEKDADGPVPEVVSSISLSAPNTNLVPLEEITIAATAKAADGRTITATINWTTSDASVATVSSAGVLKALAPGSAVIGASSGSVQASITVTVDQGGLVGPAGATLSGFNGGVRLVVPAGALSANTAIRLRGIATPPADPTFVRASGAAVQFSGSFAQPARLTLSYVPAERPAGLPEARLGLRVLNNGAWQTLASSTVDAIAHTASADITASGDYGVGMAPSSTQCTAPEHHLFDFRLGSFTWAGPATLSGEAEISADASGCSLRETLRITNGSESRAVFFFEPSNSQWHYTSVSGATYTRLSGGLEGGRMVLYNATRASRVVWEQTSTDAHKQVGETSSDGVNFTRQAEGVYTRKAAAAGNVITPAGGTVVLANGALTLHAPPGAVTQNVTPTASVAAAGGPLDATLVRGAQYTLTLTPSVQFLQPVQLTIKYDPANGPAGVPESQYGLARVATDAWQTVANSQVNTTSKTVSAPINGAGVFSVHRMTPNAPCAEAEHRQFDFWIGEWLVNSTPSSITRDLAGCTIYEHYQAPMIGKSISVYDASTQKWYQTYVTSSGGLLVMSGGLENGKMVMYERAAGGRLLSRWTWERVDESTVTQRAERTQDNGATWTQQFLGTYRKR